MKIIALQDRLSNDMNKIKHMGMIAQHGDLMIYYLGVFILLIFIKSSYNNRFRMNISKFNVYVFEYESCAKKVIVPYNVLFVLFQIISYSLFLYALSSRYLNYNLLSHKLLFQFLILITFYTFYKIIAEFLLMMSIKKTALIPMIRHVRISFHNYLAYYAFIISFLLYFFPFQNNLFTLFSVVSGAVFIFLNELKYYNTIKKHTDLKTFQIFLYLCTLEILPAIFIFYRVSFHVL